MRWWDDPRFQLIMFVGSVCSIISIVYLIIITASIINEVLLFLGIILLIWGARKRRIQRKFRTEECRDEAEKPAQVDEPKLASYTEDKIDGITWRWDYASLKTPRKFRPFCPDCDMALEPRITPQGDLKKALNISQGLPDYPEKVNFFCTKCETPQKTYSNTTPAQERDKVRREVERKIRTGEWKDVVKKPSRTVIVSPK